MNPLLKTILHHSWMLVLLVLLASMLPTSTNAQSGEQNPTTEEALAAAVVPARDLNDLALRLGGVESIAPPPTTPQRQYAVGDEDMFFVHGDNDVSQVRARLVYANDVVYMWFDANLNPDLATIQRLADQFANEVYPRVRAVFGEESSPGVDGDERLHVLHTNSLGVRVAGYFYSIHQYSTDAIDVSNQREMFFMAPDLFGVPNNYYLGVLAHEFQHMIQFNVDSNEDSWMDEGLSELATYQAGFAPSDWTPVYLDNPTVQLNNWPIDRTGPIYGGSFLFNAYLLQQYGVDFVQALVADPANGMPSVDNTLQAFSIVDPLSGEPMTAETVFSEWTLANVIGDTSVYDGRYGYGDAAIAEFELAEVTGTFNQLPVNVERGINQWGAYYYRVGGAALSNQALTLSFSGSNEISLQPVSAFSGEYAYWSNRTNAGDARLTGRFDLTNVNAATLTFQTWYDIEENWDWAYLVVSSDDGLTWDIIRTPRTSNANPFGTNYDYGYTGGTGSWVQEQVDLSAYAGQEILIRFEYVTDDATLGNGMLIDDVAIPEIGFFDDFESPSEVWNSEGWVRSNNRLPQRYTVHMIQNNLDGSLQVFRLLGPDDGTTGSWALTFPPDVKDAIFVVSAFAPLTTEQASISLTLQ